MSAATDNARGSGLAGGVIAVATLEILVSKGFLNLDDCQYILTLARNMLSDSVLRTSEGARALEIIGALSVGKFSKRNES
jgi:hypothetical protein